jgi:voltage-gated potassium channel
MSLHSATYNVFILVLTIFSLMLMLVLILPVQHQVKVTIYYIDTAICIVFLGDFLSNLRRSPRKRAYFLSGGGWLDLLGSIPAIPAIPWTALLRLARFGRLTRIVRFLRDSNRHELWKDFRSNRAQSALFVTILIAIAVVSLSAIVVLQVENARGDNPNITSGADAFWWAYVTVTTVGYGDRYPTTGLGRLMAILLMTIGVGIFGVLTSYMATSFLAPSKQEDPSGLEGDEISSHLAILRDDMAAMSKTLQRLEQRMQDLGHEKGK